MPSVLRLRLIVAALRLAVAIRSGLRHAERSSANAQILASRGVLRDGLAVIVGLVLEIYLTRKDKNKPLMVPLALNADNRAKKKKLDGPIAFFGPESSLPASASRTEFLEKTAAWNKEVGEILDENLARQQKNG